jgi:predicted carbohydrate-binding protein with CBM5 and CBM33 domain
MTVRRILARIALAGAAPPLLLLALTAAPAHAHGALANPVSRVYACGPEGGQNAQSTACKAAIAANGTQGFADWDNLRVANVAGRDRQVIPDGKLCSGGLPAFKGLDLARADWPTTKLSSGASFTFSYRETIPHKGTFRLYITRDGYDPTRSLTWAALNTVPFLTATDPTLTNGAYVLNGRVPAGKTGRQLIYTIWQNSSTSDTYYSCSDVVFTAASASSSAAVGAAPAPSVSALGAPPSAGDNAAPAISKASNVIGMMPFAVTGAAVLAVAAIVGTVIVRRGRVGGHRRRMGPRPNWR